MPATSVIATTVAEVKLKPSLRRKLLNELHTYGALKLQRDALDEQIQAHKGNIEEALAETGEQSLALEGYKTTLVCPVKSKLEVKKLLAQGVTTAMIEAATVTSPGKSYVRITLPGGKENEF